MARGEADAGSNDLINLMAMRQASDHRERYDIIDIGERFDVKPFGVAVKKGNRSLVEHLNAAITALKAKGVIDRLLKKNISDA